MGLGLFLAREIATAHSGRLEVESELNVLINKRLKEEGIEIPFPQRDLHLRSVDPRIRLSPRDEG